MDFKPVHRAILIDILVYRDDKAENIARRTDYHRNTISSEIKPLVQSDYLSQKGGGVYRLTDNGFEVARSLLRQGYNPYVGAEPED